ncbi:MAG: tetratricopeptide repeat protein [Clostridiales Family XIII bacterium]|jgi:tetratricopeptide (TPR) repeat protein|nr:tetratricopeptide repeat protein [Clostridiales Family XIII bacterium]
MGTVTRLFDRPSPFALRPHDGGDAQVKRRESETHLTKRPDRVKQYLLPRMKEFKFDEFKKDYIDRTGLAGELAGVPIPLRAEDREAFKTPEGLRGNIIAENMARVLGIDPKFKYAAVYSDYIERFFGKKAVDNMTRKAKDLADKEEYEEACVYFRAALVFKFDDLAAMYGYARILRQLYNMSANEAYTGNLKAESLDYLELTTETYPRFDMAWYYLGYLYLNLGLYIKAKLAWEKFIGLGRIAKDRKEIRQRIAQIATPIEIEKGYNAVLAERWEEGLEILENYKDSVYKDWWPLWYYLGVAYARTGRAAEAEAAFKTALKGSPRHIETMEELVAIYEARGDKQGMKKYADKLALVRKDAK